ncbi:unnamed protein product [Brugia pahangi]|uniref:Uncharacterized protein n=1 Tax=Brugia pahangi TaxID=6280 RepID=A0A0N4TV31_BRUPA|nr:unnamed protein product [Brugia pahangi]
MSCQMVTSLHKMVRIGPKRSLVVHFFFIESLKWVAVLPFHPSSHPSFLFVLGQSTSDRTAAAAAVAVAVAVIE